MAREKAQVAEKAERIDRRRKAPGEKKTARVLTYWRPKDLAEVDKCAKLLGLAVNAFVTQSAVRRARRVLRREGKG